MLRDVVGLTQVLFGADYPYLRRDMAVRSADHMRRTTRFQKRSGKPFFTEMLSGCFRVSAASILRKMLSKIVETSTIRADKLMIGNQAFRCIRLYPPHHPSTLATAMAS